MTSLVLGDNLLAGSFPTITQESLAALEQAFSIVQERLQAFANEPEFQQKLALAFGDRFHREVVQNLAQAWRKGDFSIIPEIEILSASAMNGARGAFAVSTHNICFH